MAQTPEPILYECKRMHLRATTLPCGEHRYCFRPEICDLVPVGATLAAMERKESARIQRSHGSYGNPTKSHDRLNSKEVLAERANGTGPLVRGRQYKRPQT